ncbi:MAG: hypothetical protein AABX73_02900 [Nanoarchaeota archaeon]
MRDDIAAGLRGAISHGSSIEDAVQSFINSGYNPQEVKAAAQLITSGASDIIYSENSKEEGMKTDMLPTISGERKEKKRIGRGRKIAFIIILVIIVIGILGAAGYLVYNLL